MYCPLILLEALTVHDYLVSTQLLARRKGSGELVRQHGPDHDRRADHLRVPVPV